MFAELQGMVDNGVAYVEELLGAQQKPVEPDCAYTAWFKHVVETTWLQNPQNAYNLVAIIVAFTVIATGVHYGWKQLQSIKSRRSSPAASAALSTSSPAKPSTRAATAASASAAAKQAAPAEAAVEPKSATRSSARRTASKKPEASSGSRSRSASAKPVRPKRAAGKKN